MWEVSKAHVWVCLWGCLQRLDHGGSGLLVDLILLYPLNLGLWKMRSGWAMYITGDLSLEIASCLIPFLWQFHPVSWHHEWGSYSAKSFQPWWVKTSETMIKWFLHLSCLYFQHLITTIWSPRNTPWFYFFKKICFVCLYVFIHASMLACKVPQCTSGG